MKLPFADQAVIPSRKITDYLLNVDHPKGRSKAEYFRAQGYSPRDIARFRRDLHSLAANSEMKQTITAFGVKFSGAGSVLAPNRQSIDIRTVWMCLNSAPPPVLVTAYPESDR